MRDGGDLAHPRRRERGRVPLYSRLDRHGEPRLAACRVARANADSRLLAATPPAVRAQCTKDDTVALFFGVGPLLSRVAELAFADGRLVVGSSANLAGTGNNAALADVPRSMRDGVDFEVDHGPARFGNERRLASSLLDLPSARFLREGVCFGEIEASWERR